MPQPYDSNDSPPVLLEVERFEQVRAGAERVLLRLDGRYGDRPGRRVLEARLFVDDGLAVHRHSPLRNIEDDPAGEAWLWQASYEVPASYLTDARTRFAIESEPGRLLDLPRPAQMLSASSLPISARAAHLARKYAGAVAAVLAVALVPGGLPAQAGDLIRVQRPDGTIVFMTPDGQTIESPPLSSVPPQPAATQSAAPSAQPPADPKPPSSSQQAVGTDAHQKQQKPGNHPAAAPKKPAKPHAKAKPKPKTAQKKHHHHAPAHKKHHHAAHPSPSASTASAAPQSPSQPRPQTPAQAPTAAPAPAPPANAAALQSPSNLVADGAQPLQPAGNLAPSQAPPPPPTNVPDLKPPTHPVPVVHGGKPQRPSGGDITKVPPLQTRGHIRDVPGPAPANRNANPPKRATSTSTTTSSPPTSSGTPSTAPSGGNVFNSLPGPQSIQGVPNFVLQSFRIPPFLLSIYQAAGIQYGIRWEVLAAINEIETDYGRNLNVSSAGALGWMQFMPATWKTYGVDANKDGKADPYNPVDAIFAAARYLKAAGGDKDIRRAIFAYNHAGWYVDSVMLRARLIAGYPTDLIGSLTGLTEGRFPVAARAHYAGDGTAKSKQVGAGQNATNLVSANANATGIDIYAAKGAPIVAVNDGVIKAIGRSKTKGLYIVLQDVYGNRYTYSGLGSLSQRYPVPKAEAQAAAAADANFKPVGANDPAPNAPATAGLQKPGTPTPSKGPKSRIKRAAAKVSPAPIFKQRLFAHPERPEAKLHGGLQQLIAAGVQKGFETYDNYFSRGLGLNSKNAVLRPLKVGSQVIGTTVLGHVGGGKSPHFHFEIQPAGKGAPQIDPKPFLDGWRLLESTAIYRAKGGNVLYGNGSYSIGEIMLLPKPLLEKRVLSDPRIKIYPAGRNDIKTGQIDRRVLVVLAYLAESGLDPTVSCLKSGHSDLTSSGNVSEHASGNAVDIAAINGIPIAGHQNQGGIAEQTVKRLMMLQGTLAPHQIISLLDFGANTLSLPDHADHIHVGFRPLFGSNAKLGKETQSVLKPGQWNALVQRLGQIQNPIVPTTPSRYALPDSQTQGK